MKLNNTLLLLLGIVATASVATAFVPKGSRFSAVGRSRCTVKSSVETTEACGCGDVILGGNPSDRAKKVNVRQTLSQQSVYNAVGQQVGMGDLLQEGTSDVSIAVFLRSLG